MRLTEIQMEQLRIFNDCIVMHPKVQTIFNDFDELRENRKFQSDQQCMLLTGDTGVGKSHLINHYKNRVLATQNYSRSTMPILISRISRGKGFDATLIQMLSDLELFGSSQRKKRGYETNLTARLVESLKKANVELLIINEFQELIEFKTNKERQDIANGLKFISEEAKVPIVLVGMPWAEKIAEEPQWSSRLIRKRKLDYFNLRPSPKDKKLAKDKNINNRKYYIGYLMGLAKKMPFEEPPKLEDNHTILALYASCRGENRALKHFLSESLKLALSHNEYLEKKHFIATWDKLYLSVEIDTLDGKKTLDNPFKQDIKDIKIYSLAINSQYNPNALEPEQILTGRVFALVKTQPRST